jgi:hypothetical protein
MSAEAYIWVVLRREDGFVSVIAVPAPPPPRLTLGGVTYLRHFERDPAGRPRAASGEPGDPADPVAICARASLAPRSASGSPARPATEGTSLRVAESSQPPRAPEGRGIPL